MSSGLDRMKSRMITVDYDLRDKKIVKDKYKSFRSAVDSVSYQSEWITLDKGTDKERRWRCLINPSRLTEQFDRKVISIDFESGMKEGTVFYWDRTGEYWLCNLQQHTEEAYFRGLIAKTNYEIDVDGTKYWATIRGPIETSTEWHQNHRIIYNDLNYSLVLQLTKDSKTIDYFSRHKVIKVKMYYKDVDDPNILLEREDNFKVVATDKYSSDNVIDIYCDEWYNNEAEDIKVEHEAKVKEMEQATHEEEKRAPHIEGPSEVNVYDTNIQYTFVGDIPGHWGVTGKKVQLKSSTDPTHCSIDILMSKSGSFILSYICDNGQVVSETIKVNSL